MSLSCTTIHLLLLSFRVPALMVEPETCAPSPKTMTVWNDARPDEEDIFALLASISLLVSLLPFPESSMIFPALVNSTMLVTFRFFSSLFSPLGNYAVARTCNCGDGLAIVAIAVNDNILRGDGHRFQVKRFGQFVAAAFADCKCPAVGVIGPGDTFGIWYSLPA